MNARRALFLALLGAAFALGALAASHGVAVATPYVVMDRAMKGISARAGGYNRMAKAPPATPEARSVVRPSPDLLYSICAYDLSDGPVEARAGATDGYVSISFYDAATNNYRTVRRNDDASSRDSLVISLEGAATPESGGNTIISPTRRGVVLIRRRISSPALREAALAAQKDDVCAAV